MEKDEADELVWAVESDCFHDVFVAIERLENLLCSDCKFLCEWVIDVFVYGYCNQLLRGLAFSVERVFAVMPSNFEFPFV